MKNDQNFPHFSFLHNKTLKLRRFELFVENCMVIIILFVTHKSAVKTRAEQNAKTQYLQHQQLGQHFFCVSFV